MPLLPVMTDEQLYAFERRAKQAVEEGLAMYGIRDRGRLYVRSVAIDLLRSFRSTVLRMDTRDFWVSAHGSWEELPNGIRFKVHWE